VLLRLPSLAWTMAAPSLQSLSTKSLTSLASEWRFNVRFWDA